jgi:D-2-hydroxyacid dehydrogenase (NADP+)
MLLLYGAGKLTSGPNAMTDLLILLTLPKPVAGRYHDYLTRRFPQLQVDLADHHSRVDPYIDTARILVTFAPMLSDDVLRKGRNLGFVQALGTGVDNLIDLPSLRPDTVIANLRGVHGAPMSEGAFMAMLALSRDLPRNIRNQDNEVWERWPSRLIDAKTVGIFGIGLIAENLAPRCKAFGMTVVGFSSAPRDVPGFDRVYDRRDLVARAGELDYLILLSPYSADTHLVINDAVFKAMKPSSYLINLARGGVLDEDALLRALESGEIAGAALDVFLQEPLPKGHPLWSAKNVIVTPHHGGFSDTYVDAALPVIEHNVECFLRGDVGAMQNRVER